MEAIKLCRLDTPIIFIEARINLSRFVVTGCAAKTSATVTFPSLRSEERFSRNAETDLVCRLLLEKKKTRGSSAATGNFLADVAAGDWSGAPRRLCARTPS